MTEFNNFVKIAEVCAFIARSTKLQKRAIEDLEQYLIKLAEFKLEYIKKLEEESANAILAIECMINALRSELKMFVLLKNEEPEEAWIKLIDAEDYASAAVKAHAIGKNAEKRIPWYEAIEEYIFPPQAYESVGYVAIRRECTICNGDYDECEHIIGQPYMGKLCSAVVVEGKILEISFVDEPYDKRCRITHFSEDKKMMRNKMTWELENRSNNSAAESQTRHLEGKNSMCTANDLKPERRLDAYIALAKAQMEHFRSAVQVEWKVTFAAWTLLVVLSYAAAKEDIRLTGYEWTVFILPVLHLIWLILIHDSQDKDKSMWVAFRRKALDELDHGPTDDDNWKKRTFFRHAIWLFLEVGITFILTLVAWKLLNSPTSSSIIICL